jgi:hypothetical protein
LPELLFDDESIQSLTIENIPVDYRDCFVINPGELYQELITGTAFQELMIMDISNEQNYGGKRKNKKNSRKRFNKKKISKKNIYKFKKSKKY